MKILIVGNLGYIGPVAIAHFKNTLPDAEIYGYDIGYFTGNETIQSGLLPETKLTSQFYGDVRNFDPKYLNNIDSVIYLAAISNDPMGNAFEKPTLEINKDCAVTIAKAAKQKGVKSFVFASSCSVYGLADSSPRTEKSDVNPLTAYAKSKVFAEKELEPLASPDFKITCLRFATACGFSPRLRLDLVLNDFVASAIVHKRIDILSDGKPWRPLINVKDMARAMEWASTRQSNEPFLIVNAGSDEWNYQVFELAEAVQNVIPGTQVSINEKAQPDNRSYRVDFSLFNKMAPALYPKCDLTNTIKELQSGLEAIHFNDKNFRSSHLIRLKTLNGLLEAKSINQNLERVN
jgi:nucleoside-diphosphate-sugar epimerase